MLSNTEDLKLKRTKYSLNVWTFFSTIKAWAILKNSYILKFLDSKRMYFGARVNFPRWKKRLENRVLWPCSTSKEFEKGFCPKWNPIDLFTKIVHHGTSRFGPISPLVFSKNRQKGYLVSVIFRDRRFSKSEITTCDKSQQKKFRKLMDKTKQSFQECENKTVIPGMWKQNARAVPFVLLFWTTNTIKMLVYDLMEIHLQFKTSVVFFL